MATELFSADFDSATELAAYDLKTSGNPDTHIVSENGNGVVDFGLDRHADEVSYRSEIELAGRNPARFAEIGKTYTYSFDMRLSEDWVHDDRPEILFQLHSSPDPQDGSRGPALALQLTPSQDHSTTYYSIVQRADERAQSDGTYTSHARTTVGRVDGDLGEWVNWTFQIHLSPNDDGQLTLWKDGVIVLHQEAQANTFNDQQGPYAKWGVYKWDWQNEATIATSRDLQLDNLRIVEGDDAALPSGFAAPSSLSSSGGLALASGGHTYASYYYGSADGSSGVDMDGAIGDGTLVGTPYDDYLHDGLGDDTLYGGAGDDRLVSGPGNDTIHAGDGDDRAELGDGNDLVQGDNDNDTLLGGSGNDRLYGGNNNDTLRGQVGDDWLFGGSGDDKLDGGPGDDHLDGGGGENVLICGGGKDVMIGGRGGDLFLISADAVLRDFSHAEGDKIDLSAFGPASFVGTEAFSASGFIEVRSGKGELLIDVNGNGTYDCRVELLGTSDTLIVVSDLILG